MSPASRSLRRGAIATAIAMAGALSAAPAGAQTAEELAAARQTFAEGKDLEKKHAWSEALEKFQKVASVKMTPQVRFHIALCEENLGKLVSAMRGFELAAEEARLAGSSAAEVAQNAPGRAEALKKRIGTLQITSSGRVLTSKILVDGVPLGATALGAEVPIDPGKHVVEVRDKDGNGTFKKEVEIAEKSAEKVVVTVDDPDPSAKPPEVVVPPPPPPSRAPVFIAGGIGAASLIASGVLYGLRANTITDVLGTCKDTEKLTGCDPNLKETAETGRMYSTLSGVFLGVGIAGAVATGILIFVTNPKKQPQASLPKASLLVGPGAAGLAFDGVF